MAAQAAIPECNPLLVVAVRSRGERARQYAYFPSRARRKAAASVALNRESKAPHPDPLPEGRGNRSSALQTLSAPVTLPVGNYLAASGRPAPLGAETLPPPLMGTRILSPPRAHCCSASGSLPATRGGLEPPPRGRDPDDISAAGKAGHKSRLGRVLIKVDHRLTLHGSVDSKNGHPSNGP